MRIPESKIEEINDKVNIVDLVSEYVSLKPKGGRYWGLCPFHNEKTPSFSVTLDKNIYYCFGCHKGGGAINFLMEIEKLDFIDSVKMLAKKAGVTLDLSENDNSEYSGKRDAMLELYKRVSGSFRYILENSESAGQAREYIAARGINQETSEKFELGFAPYDFNWLFNFLKKKNYSLEFLGESGLFSKNKKNFPLFINRLIFPVFSVRNEVIGFSGRELGNRGPKYINTPETLIFHKGSQLYGISQALSDMRKKKQFILCEGNIDVLALHQSGYTNAVAPLGTAFTSEQAKLLKRYADSGIIVFDGDEAGIKATSKAIIICESFGIEVSVAELPQGRDPADIMQKDGVESLHKILKYPITSFEYLYKCAIRAYDVRSPEGMEKVVREIFPYITSIRSDVKRDVCLSRLAEKLGIGKESILSDFLRQKKAPVRRDVVKKDEAIKISDELYLMLAGAANRDYFNIISSSLGIDDLKDKNAVLLFSAVMGCEEAGEETVESLLMRIGEGPLKSLLVEKLSSSQFLINPEDVIRDSVKTIMLRNMMENRARIESDIRNFGLSATSSEEDLKGLISEKLSLDKKIEELKR
ncbi:DNA primase [Spirochaeta isovalerica]|uniref:DNA primase n=1 Tax=Spirochaeta isovalerica TaxID=150 RepID=A0A841R5F6_9SPIO|nr:DNA primase [Spirochaeta isovalerica]MBB6479095.1 DNA primase [Spirochaeta isovalerica]